MLDIKRLTQEVLENKIKNHFPTDDLAHEFDLFKKEVVEAEEVLGDPPKLVNELADIVIFAMSIARITGQDLEQAIVDKVEYNKNRTYKAGTFRLNEKATE